MVISNTATPPHTQSLSSYLCNLFMHQYFLKTHKTKGRKSTDWIFIAPPSCAAGSRATPALPPADGIPRGAGSTTVLCPQPLLRRGPRGGSGPKAPESRGAWHFLQGSIWGQVVAWPPWDQVTSPEISWFSGVRWGAGPPRCSPRS